ncbi:MAG: formate dehydrogenase-N subunit alpha, partial [Dehalococcoidales bacterium]|nr:formate dehydrogenase-N subunit alpha [Dehalococcoidales bacterium]MDD5498163.1 formate dehydrogenase-N subunit alpha [Dehalococcoidales bacterium]
MTNHYIDLKNSDCIMIIGSNAAENHPISFRWITKAKERGGKLISVDPRFTRTSSKADIYAPIRSGTDIAFIGGMINYVISDIEQNPDNYNMEYITQYTNASYILNPDFEFNDGLFGEIEQKTFNGSYTAASKATWKYAGGNSPEADITLKDPSCVFQMLKKHYSRYDADTVCRITGTPKEDFLKVCQAYAETGKKDKAGTICYAMGATQHTYGVQNIRGYSLLQTLLGNMGVAGGGINALRGTSNVQGSTDMALLEHILPGYLDAPIEGDNDIDTYLRRSGKHPSATITPPAGLAADTSANWWQNTRKYIVSLLKTWYGDAATPDNEFGFHWLPKKKPGVNYSHIALIEAIASDIIKGLWIWGQNPAAGGPNANGAREAFAKLDWMVSIDIWENETAIFWKRPGVDPTTIKTEVFMLPAACSYEKEGSIANSGRWAQWRYKAVEPNGEAIADLEIMADLMNRIRKLYQDDTSAPGREGILNLTWDYDPHTITADQIARELNGYDLTTGKLMASFANLKDDGTTTSGNWLYCNSYTEDGNKLKKRDPVDAHPQKIGLHSNWAWCWPVNRRIIYNRAAVDLNGNPYDVEHPVISWDAAGAKWVGDVPDGGWAPINIAESGAKTLPFIMKPEGVARLWGFGNADGPLPEVYEPWESPLENNLMSGQKNNPCAFIGKWMNEQGTPDKYPYVGTTYRCTEHWQTGIMTRSLPWLVELMPDMFAEMDPELAEAKGINNGDNIVVSSARGEVRAVAIVTKRFKPLTVDGKTIHQIG